MPTIKWNEKYNRPEEECQGFTEAIKALKEIEREQEKIVYCLCGKKMVPLINQCPDRDCEWNLIDVMRSGV